MTDVEMKEILRSILEMLKQQTLFLDRQQGWLIALADTIGKNPAAAESLKAHSFYRPNPQIAIDNIDVMLRKADALIQQLK